METNVRQKIRGDGKTSGENARQTSAGNGTGMTNRPGGNGNAKIQNGLGASRLPYGEEYGMPELYAGHPGCGMPDAPGGIGNMDTRGTDGGERRGPMVEWRTEELRFVYKGIPLEARTAPTGEYDKYLFISSIFGEHPLKGTPFQMLDIVFVKAEDKKLVSDSRNWRNNGTRTEG